MQYPHQTKLSWENIVKFTDVCLVFKMLNGMAPPPLSDFIKQTGRHTRSASRGDCIISHRSSSFSKSAFSVIQHTLGMLCHHTYAQKTHTKHLNIALRNGLLVRYEH